MKVFCHINDLDIQGWEALRTLVIGCEKVAIWAPSAALLLRYADISPHVPTASELLWYIEHGHVQVMARRWWLTNDQRRQHHRAREIAMWVDDFDSQLLRMWEQDQIAGVSFPNARVMAVADSSARNWATEQVEAGFFDVDRVYEMAEQSVPLHAQLKQIPDKKLATLRLVTELREHGEAFAWSGADRNLGSPRDPDLFKILSDSFHELAVPVSSIYSRRPAVDRFVASISESIHTIQGAEASVTSADSAFVRVKKILRDPQEVLRFRDWFNQCDSASETIDDDYLETVFLDHLAREINQGSIRENLLNYLIPKTPIQRLAAGVGVVLCAAGFAIGSPLAPISAALLGLRPFEQVLRRAGFISEEYSGPRWPFYIAAGSEDVDRRTRERLVRRLTTRGDGQA